MGGDAVGRCGGNGLAISEDFGSGRASRHEGFASQTLAGKLPRSRYPRAGGDTSIQAPMRCVS